MNEANRNRYCSPMGDSFKLRLHALGIKAVGMAQHRDDVTPPTNPNQGNALFGEPIHHVERQASAPVQHHDAGAQIRRARKEAPFLQRLRVMREAISELCWPRRSPSR